MATCKHTYAIRSKCRISSAWISSHTMAEQEILVSKNYRAMERLLFDRLDTLRDMGLTIDMIGDVILHSAIEGGYRDQYGYLLIQSQQPIEDNLLVVNYGAVDSCALSDLWDSMEAARADVS